jgi:succinoglycan biosynthesis transport protein ExoP
MNHNPLIPHAPGAGSVSMQAQSSGGGMKLIDPLRVLRQNIWLLMTAGILGVVLGVGVWGVWRITMPRWSSVAQLSIQPPSDSPTGTIQDIVDTRGTASVEAFISGEIMRIKSEDTLRSTVADPAVQDTKWFKTFNGDNIEASLALEEDVLRTSMPPGSFVIELRVRTRFKHNSQIILATIIKIYQQKRVAASLFITNDLKKTFLTERERADKAIQQLDRQIGDFIEENTLDSITVQHSSAGLGLQTLTQEQIDSQSALSQMRESYKSMVQSSQASNFEPTTEDLAQIEMLPEIQRLNQDENSYHQQIGAAERRWGPNHMQTKSAKALLEALELRKEHQIDLKVRELRAVKLETTLQTIGMLEGMLFTLAEDIQEATKKVADLQGLIDEHSELLSRRESEKVNYDHWDQALSEARINSTRPDFNIVQIHSPANEPELTRPLVTWVVPITTIMFTGMATGLVFLRELIDQRVKSPADVKLLPNTDLLGLIPQAGEDPSGQGQVENAVAQYPTGLLAEAFRNVRTGLMAKMDRRGYKTLMLVGAQPGCGTSTVIHNLAASFVLNDRKVVIVDANFRRPDQHRIADVSNARGLADILRGRATLRDALQQSDRQGLSLLPSGQAANEPPELLESAKFRSLLSELEAQFDIVLIDVAPALLAADSQLLTKHVDAVAMVVRASADTHGMVVRMHRKLDGHRADLLGVILNDVRSSIGGYFRKNYEQFYRYQSQGADGNALSTARERAASATMEKIDIDED